LYQTALSVYATKTYKSLDSTKQTATMQSTPRDAEKILHILRDCAPHKWQFYSGSRALPAFLVAQRARMAETEAAEESVEGGADGEQGEEYVAEAETSQTEGGEEGEGDENNTTYNTDVVEEEVPTQVDPDAATLEDIFGLDEDEEEPEQEQM
jgi:hypothetical protein